MGFPSPAIGLLELESIARGIACVDAVLKKAPVRLHLHEAVTPGKYLLLFSGGVAEVEASFAAGLERAGDRLIDKLFLPQAHPQLAAAVADSVRPIALDSLGIVETHTVSAALLGADVACKTASVTLTSIRLARGIGGKGYFTLSGPLPDVEAALEAAAAAIGHPALLGLELVPAPDRELPSGAL